MGRDSDYHVDWTSVDAMEPLTLGFILEAKP